MTQFRMPQKPTPRRRCYWVLDDLLLAGAYPGKADPQEHLHRITGLYQAGMQTFISLMESHEKNNDGIDFVPYKAPLKALAQKDGVSIFFKNYPIKDRSITTVDNMRDVLDAIDHSLDRKIPVYVHCFGGIGRTGMVICCWLLRHGYANSEDVFDLLSQLRKSDLERATWPAPENDAQCNFVRTWVSHDRCTDSKKTTLLPPATKSDWFTRLTGFSERSADEVRTHLKVEGENLIVPTKGKTYVCGRLEIPSLEELRQQVSVLPTGVGRLEISELVGDAQNLHKDPSNAGAVFQVASQFNLLEMVSPTITPEQGVGIYQNDPTQGPACAVACGAGTIYRNYFVDLKTQIGQSEDCQVDCLEQLGQELGNTNGKLWKMQNGYALASYHGLQMISRRLSAKSNLQLDDLKGKLRIGVQWNTQVTLPGVNHQVTQAYCSALPLAYSTHDANLWEPFARLVLEAAYEATFSVAILNSHQTGNRLLFLTNLGGGAFGNKSSWIYEAIGKAVSKFAHWDLQVKMVSYRYSNPETAKFIASFLDGNQDP